MKTIAQRRSAGIGLERRIKKAINDLGGQAMRMPGSGSYEGLKGDLSISLGAARFLGECKKSMGNSIRIKVEWLEKISKEAKEANRVPALFVAWNRGPILVAMPLLKIRHSLVPCLDPVVSKFKFHEVEEVGEVSFSFAKVPELGVWHLMELEDWVQACWLATS